MRDRSGDGDGERKQQGARCRSSMMLTAIPQEKPRHPHIPLGSCGGVFRAARTACAGLSRSHQDPHSATQALGRGVPDYRSGPAWLTSAGCCAPDTRAEGEAGAQGPTGPGGERGSEGHAAESRTSRGLDATKMGTQSGKTPLPPCSGVFVCQADCSLPTGRSLTRCCESSPPIALLETPQGNHGTRISPT